MGDLIDYADFEQIKNDIDAENLTESTEVISYVTTRDGKLEPMSYDKINDRYKKLAGRSDSVKYKHLAKLKKIDISEIIKEVIKGTYNQVDTRSLDMLAAQTAASKVSEDEEYEILSTRILVSDHQKTVSRILENHFGKKGKIGKEIRTDYLYNLLYSNVNEIGVQAPLIEPRSAAFGIVFSRELGEILDLTRDFKTNYAGFKLLHKNYMLKSSYRNDDRITKRLNKIIREPVETPQDIFMRVSVFLAVSKEYIEWNLYNDKAVLEEIKGLPNFEKIGKILVHDYEYLIKNGERVSWKKLIDYLSHEDLALATEIDSIVKNYYTSWTGVLNRWKDHWKNVPRSEIKEILANIKNNYDRLSNQNFIQATPTMYNAGTLNPQCSSCFLLGGLSSDSMIGITNYLKQCAMLSKNAGGIGGHISNIRSKKSYISGTNGESNGIEPLIRVINELSIYVDQGGGKRPGSNAIYIDIWHEQVMDMLDMKRHKKNSGKEKATSLFYALMIPDHFFRVLLEEYHMIKANPDAKPKLWYLFDPNKTNYLYSRFDRGVFRKRAGLLDYKKMSYTEFNFTKHYMDLVEQKLYSTKVSAIDLLLDIVECIRETGVPYMKFKDNVNRKNNQEHYATITTSNLCIEIDEVVTSMETAVCNLASLCLPTFLIRSFSEEKIKKMAQIQRNKFEQLLGKENPLLDVYSCYGEFSIFDINSVIDSTKTTIGNLDKIIDVNFYPIPEARTSNVLHRPCGLGIQGLADLFCILLIPYDSDMAKKVGFYLQELIYWAALTKSNELAREKGTYGSYNRSWVQRGKLQMDLYVQEGNKLAHELSPFWDVLRPKIAQDGVRNSLLICLMPTASTSTITGFSPSFEPHMGMYYTRKNNSTETMIVNKNLVRLLKRLNLWNSSVSTTILADKYGGISQIKSIPEDIRRVYRTVWEMDPHAVVEYCKTISPFIDQSMSMNLFVEKPDFNTLINIYLNGWTGGLKSGSYYCRSKAQYDADKTVVDKDIVICESCQ